MVLKLYVIYPFRNPYSCNNALANYQRARQLDQDTKISANKWDRICWLGSLNGIAEEVLPACERSIKQEPDYIGWRDSRGIAYALTDNTDEAIEDFQAYIDWSGSPPSRKQQRRKWIEQLKLGNSPFTEDLLKELKEE